jgi:hypothetical protein
MAIVAHSALVATTDSKEELLLSRLPPSTRDELLLLGKEQELLDAARVAAARHNQLLTMEAAPLEQMHEGRAAVVSNHIVEIQAVAFVDRHSRRHVVTALQASHTSPA